MKPGNILLDSEGNAKIVDFGLALVTKGGKAKATEIWATPYYVPPEAIEGETEDFRADIYAFGATLYHALAGKPPCDEESMATDVLREAKKKIIPLKKVAPTLLDETCAVIDRAMAYEPNKRFSSYDEMIAGLQTALKIARGDAVKDSDGVTRSERREQLRARKRRSMLLIASAVAISVAGVSTLILLNQSEPKPAKSASKSLTVDTGDDGKSESPREIASRYAGARNSMEKGNFEKAGKMFSALLNDNNVQEPTRTWSGLQSVVAALMDGRMDLAKKYSAATEAHISSGPAGLDPGFLVGTRPVLSQISNYGFIPAETLDLGATGKERFMGYFIAALTNWENGGLDQSVSLFKSIANEQTLADDTVLNWYQKIAKNYLADHRALATGAMNADPKTEKECRDAIGNLDQKLALLKTNGRARFNIRARQLDFARLEKSIKSRPKAIPKPTQDTDVMAEIQTLAKEYKFIEIVEKASRLTTDPPGCSREALLGISQSALVFLTELETDLASNPVVISLKTKDETEVSSLGIASEEQLVGKLPDGEVIDLVWTDFSTEQLVEAPSRASEITCQ